MQFDFGFPSSSGVLRVASSECPSLQKALPCTFLERDGRWLQLRMQQPVRAASVVGIEYEDVYYAGEIAACFEHEGAWMVQVIIEQIITNLQSLLRLHQELGLMSTPPVAAPSPVAPPQAAPSSLVFAGIYD